MFIVAEIEDDRVRVAEAYESLTKVAIRSNPKKYFQGSKTNVLVIEFSKDQTKEGVQSQEVVEVFAIEISPPWIVYADGATNQRGSKVGVVIVSPDGIVLEKSLKLSFSATNNKAKYEALWSRLEAVKGLGGNNIEVFSDSQLIVGQVLREYNAKDARMQAYLGKIKQL
ncbi:uncharacterized protein LOC142605785 [Castanea sativa]|uniref:uncharacterized protein LOC142605785 n=1 Tax=Castanea sativa TaxID=21020 RepID=UPI003F64E4C2